MSLNPPPSPSPPPTPSPSHLPPPLTFSPLQKKTSILICTLALLTSDLLLPLLLYYTLSRHTSISLAINLGVSCASLGLCEFLELPLRGYRLISHPEKYAPLGSPDSPSLFARLDFFFWWYALATIVGIVPYVLATSLDEPIPWLFLYTPGLLVGFAALTGVASVCTCACNVRILRCWCKVSGERCKPFVYYVLEDFVAVDAGQGRAWRAQLRARWKGSPMFRRVLWEVNVGWVVGGGVFCAALAGIVW
ncbi:hypothetical protein LSUB1_G004742, partial [Lachnellula subtilissima]